MMKVWYSCAVAAVLALVAGGRVRADLIVQKDGAVVEGKVLSRDAKGLSVQVEGKTGQPPVQVAADAVARVIQIDAKGAMVAEGVGVSVPTKRAEPRWGFPAEPVAPPIAPAASGPTYYVVPLHGEVGDTYTPDLLEKSLADATKRRPTVVVLDINSPGGKISEAETMIKTLHRYNKELRIVALVDQNLSASAIISLSVRSIFMKSTGTFGAATALHEDELLGPVALQAKFQSAWRAVARSSAEEGGHEPLLAEAMIDNLMELHVETVDGKKVVKEGRGPSMLTKPGRILTLTSREAVNCGLAVDLADDLNELGQKLNLTSWKECRGLGVALADYVVKRREVYEQKRKEIETDFRANLEAAESAMPSEGPITRQFSIGRGGTSGADEPRPRFTIDEFRKPTARQRAEWNGHSLAAVVALQKAEQDVQDYIALGTAFNHKEIDPEMKALQTALGMVRARLYDERYKITDDSTDSTAILARMKALKIAPLPAKLSDLARRAVEQKTYAIGLGPGSIFASAPEVMAPDGGVLIGLRCGRVTEGGDANAITALQGVYLTTKGVVLGEVVGDPDAVRFIDVVARDGYAVSGMKMSGSGPIEGVQLQFGRMGEGRLRAGDIYESEVVGRMTKTLAVAGAMPVVGMRYTTFNGVCGLCTLLYMKTPEAKPMSAAPKAGGPAAPLAAAFAEAVKDAQAKKAYMKGGITGNTFAGSDFEDMAPDGGILLGFQFGIGKNGTYITSLQPIYLTAHGEVLGKIQGEADPVSVEVIKAPPGYAVGAMTVGRAYIFDGMTVTFMKIGDRELLVDDSYRVDKVESAVAARPSDWVATSGGDGLPMIGICGRVDQGALALGLVQMTATEMTKRKP
jgi:hypothetical protein